MLRNTSPDHGVEVDIRSWGRDLIIHHDPFVEGELFEPWIAEYRHGTLILNVKEEGLEEALLDLMKRYNLDDFFFLDQSFPFLMKTAKYGERRCAVRISEYESLETALTLSGLVEWVWVDCFTKFPIDRAAASRLTESGFKLCLVSPELQGRPAHEIGTLRETLDAEDIRLDAVCTKNPGMWK